MTYEEWVKNKVAQGDRVTALKWALKTGNQAKAQAVVGILEKLEKKVKDARSGNKNETA